MNHSGYLLIALTFAFTAWTANADVTLSCRSELSGMVEQVTVAGANNADEARRMVRSDPLYGYYFEPSCMEHNTDRPGGDLAQGFDLQSPDPRQCQAACDRKPECRAWTYVKPNTIQGPHPRCWLKGSVPGAYNNTCCISGTRSN
jgi:hypothetical protein